MAKLDKLPSLKGHGLAWNKIKIKIKHFFFIKNGSEETA